MNKAGEIFENAILNWRDAAGIGTALIPTILNDKLMVLFNITSIKGDNK